MKYLLTGLLSLLFWQEGSALDTIIGCLKGDGAPSKRVLEGISPQIEELGVVAGQALWTAGDQFEGPVIIFQGKVHLHQETNDQAQGREQVRYYMGTLDAEVQFGEEGKEYHYLNLIAITREKLQDLKSDGKFHVLKKGVEVGNVQLSQDLPLGVKSYLELEPVKVYGTVGWSPSSLPEFKFLAEASVSIGYAFAESNLGSSKNTNNFYAGKKVGLAAEHERFGRLDFHYEVDGQLTKYDPLSDSSREAKVGMSYTYEFDNGVSASLIAEKRSFRFAPGSSDNYEKGKRYMLTFKKRF